MIKLRTCDLPRICDWYQEVSLVIILRAIFCILKRLLRTQNLNRLIPKSKSKLWKSHSSYAGLGFTDLSRWHDQLCYVKEIFHRCEPWIARIHTSDMEESDIVSHRMPANTHATPHRPNWHLNCMLGASELGNTCRWVFAGYDLIKVRTGSSEAIDCWRYTKPCMQ